MSSDEARAEAERRWPGIGRGAERAALDRAMRGGFEVGAEWQAERDAERVAELEAEVKRLRAAAIDAGWATRVVECDITHEEPFDFDQCSAHDRTFERGAKCDHEGRSVVDFVDWQHMQQRGRAVRAEGRAEAAEAKLDAARELAHRIYGQIGDEVPESLARLLAVLDGGDEE